MKFPVCQCKGLYCTATPIGCFCGIPKLSSSRPLGERGRVLICSKDGDDAAGTWYNGLFKSTANVQ